MIPFGKSRSRAPTLAHRFGPWNGLAALPAPITLNSITVNPTFRYRGQDATLTTWPAWGYGETLSIAGSGDDPSINQSSPFFDGSQAVKGAGAKYYSGAGGDIATEDFIIEAVFKDSAISGSRLAGRMSAGPLGWMIARDATSYIAIYASGAAELWRWTLQDSQLIHLLFVADRSGSGITYSNSVAGTAVDISAVAGSISNSGDLCLLANPTDGSPWQSNLILLAMYKRADWLDSHLQPAFAAERFARVCSIYPMLSNNSASRVFSFARSAPAYLEKRESGATRLHYVGNGWPREVEVLDAGGVARRGLLIEKQTEINFQFSNVDQTDWAKNAISATSSTPTATPLGTLNNIVAHEDATDDAHFFANLQSALTIAAGTKMVHWGVAKAINRSWIRPAVYDSTNGGVVVARAWFDIENGAVGTEQAGASTIEALGGGWFKYKITWTQADDTSLYLMSPLIAEADADSSFQGLDQDSIAFLLPTIEPEYPTSPILVTSGSVTRAADSCKFSSQYLVGNSIGTARGAFLSPSFTPGREHTIFCLSNNESADDHVRVFVHTDGTLRFASAKTAGDAGAITLAGSVCDNVVREWLLAWSQNKIVLGCRALNGSPVWGMDTDVDIPDVHEADGWVHLGSYAAGTEPGPITVSSLKLSDKFLPSFDDLLSGFTEIA